MNDDIDKEISEAFRLLNIEQNNQAVCNLIKCIKLLQTECSDLRDKVKILDRKIARIYYKSELDPMSGSLGSLDNLGSRYFDHKHML